MRISSYHSPKFRKLAAAIDRLPVSEIQDAFSNSGNDGRLRLTVSECNLPAVRILIAAVTYWQTEHPGQAKAGRGPRFTFREWEWTPDEMTLLVRCPEFAADALAEAIEIYNKPKQEEDGDDD